LEISPTVNQSSTKKNEQIQENNGEIMSNYRYLMILVLVAILIESKFIKKIYYESNCLNLQRIQFYDGAIGECMFDRNLAILANYHFKYIWNNVTETITIVKYQESNQGEGCITFIGSMITGLDDCIGPFNRIDGYGQIYYKQELVDSFDDYYVANHLGESFVEIQKFCGPSGCAFDNCQTKAFDYKMIAFEDAEFFEPYCGAHCAKSQIDCSREKLTTHDAKDKELVNIIEGDCIYDSSFTKDYAYKFQLNCSSTSGSRSRLNQFKTLSSVFICFLMIFLIFKGTC